MKKGLLITAVLALVLGMALVSCTQDSNLDIVEVTLNLDDSATKNLSAEKNDLPIAGYGITVTGAGSQVYSNIGYNEVLYGKDDTISIKLSRGLWNFSVTAYSTYDSETKTASGVIASGTAKQNISDSSPVNITLATTASVDGTALTVKVGASENPVKTTAIEDKWTRMVVKQGDNIEVLTKSDSVSAGDEGFYGDVEFTSLSGHQVFYVIYQTSNDETTKDSEDNVIAPTDNSKWTDKRTQRFEVDMYDGIEVTITGSLTAEGAYTTNTISISGVTVSMSLGVSGKEVRATAALSGNGTFANKATWEADAEVLHASDTSVEADVSEETNAETKVVTGTSTVNVLDDAPDGLYNITCKIPVTISMSDGSSKTIYAYATGSFEWNGSALSAK